MTKNERRQLKTPDTNYFHYHNENPKLNICGDCVIRALATGMNKSWDEVYKDLYDIGFKKKLMSNDKKVYYQYLKEQGWIQCKQPRHFDNTKYSGIEFCESLQKYNTFDGCDITKNIIANVGSHHIIAIINGKVNDIWNSSNEKIGIYWYKD